MKSNNKGRSRNLTTTLAIVFAFMSMATIIVSGSFGIFFLFQSQQDAIAGMQKVVAHQAANTVAGFIQRRFSVMETALRLSRSGEERIRAMQVLLGMQPAFRQLLLVDSQNQKLFRASRMSQAESARLDQRLSDDPLPKLLGDDRHIGSVYVDQVTSEPLVIMAVPAKSIIGDMLGTLVAEVNLKFMWDLVDRLEVGATGHAYVVDRSGLLIAFGDTGRVLRGERLGHLRNVAEFMRQAEDGEAVGVNIASGITGTTVVGTYVSLKTPDWAVITELPVKEAYRPLVRSAVISSGILLAMAVMAALIGALVARRLAVPILKLADTATRIEAGELALQAAMEGPAEVIRLASAFNNMTGRLRIMLDAEEERNQKLALEVTQRKKIEQALRISEERLDLALEAANEGIWDLDLKNDRAVFDDRYYTMAGYEPGAFPGRYAEWKERVHPDDIQMTEAAINRCLSGESDFFDAEFRFMRREGTYMWIRGKGKTMAREEDGTPSRFIGTHSDITEKKHAADALRRLQDYLSNIVDSMPSVIVGVDGQGRVTQWNQTVARDTRIDAEAAQGRYLVDVLPQMQPEAAKISESIRTRQIIQIQKKKRIVEGDFCYEDITIYPLITSDIHGAVIRIDDVTERVRLEEMMIQSEKMMSVGGLAAGMAHEINNPLAGILQNSAVLYNRLFGDLPANHQAAEAAGTTLAAIGKYLELRNLTDMLDNIRNSGNRAAAIVRNMLSFARKSDRATSSNDLRNLLDQAIELARTDYDMKKKYDFKQIKIVRQYDEAIPRVPCDGSKLQQVFLNILKNGAEAMAEPANRRNSATFILRIQDDDAWVRVEIEDNGPGMDDKTRRSIFDPFFTTKPVGQGTGLGLSVSYFIITEDHGGELAAYAADSGGTRFVIRLPKAGKKNA